MSYENGAGVARFWRGQEQRYVSGGSQLFTVEGNRVKCPLFDFEVEKEELEERLKVKGFKEEVIIKLLESVGVEKAIEIQEGLLVVLIEEVLVS